MKGKNVRTMEKETRKKGIQRKKGRKEKGILLRGKGKKGKK